MTTTTTLLCYVSDQTIPCSLDAISAGLRTGTLRMGMRSGQFAFKGASPVSRAAEDQQAHRGAARAHNVEALTSTGLGALLKGDVWRAAREANEPWRTFADAVKADHTAGKPESKASKAIAPSKAAPVKASAPKVAPAPVKAPVKAPNGWDVIDTSTEDSPAPKPVKAPVKAPEPVKAPSSPAVAAVAGGSLVLSADLLRRLATIAEAAEGLGPVTVQVAGHSLTVG